MDEPLSRRAFLQLAGGTGESLLFGSGEKTVQHLIPYLNQPQYPRPGQWAQIATTCRECPAGCGLLMSYRDGRVTKAEGNPQHPINQGKLCLRGQASVQGLYDPDRLSSVYQNVNGKLVPGNWDAALNAVRDALASRPRLHLISDLQTGSLAKVMEEFAAAHDSKPLYYEPFNYESLRRACLNVYGVDRIPRVNLEGADLVVSFGVDFLETWLSPVEHARWFARLHAPKPDHTIGRMVYLGSHESLTAANSDRLVIVRPGTEAAVILALIHRLGRRGRFAAPAELPELPDTASLEMDNTTLDSLADEIAQAAAPVILAGRPEDASQAGIAATSHALVLNELLGGRHRLDFGSSHALTRTAYRGEVQQFFESISPDSAVVVHQANPCYSEPTLAHHLQRARMVIYLGSAMHETAACANWLLPVHHPLESWGDYEPWTGILSLLQPTLRPLYATMAAGDVFKQVGGAANLLSYQETVRTNWRSWMMPNAPRDAPPPREVQQRGCWVQSMPPHEPAANFATLPALSPRRENDGFYFQLVPSLFFYDGRLANRGWMQEIPHPISNIAWQSWLDIHTRRAATLGIRNGDLVEVTAGDHSLTVSVRTTRLIAADLVVLEAGLGHWTYGRTANAIGVNAFMLRESAGADGLPRVTVRPTGQHQSLLRVHPTYSQHGRQLLQWQPWSELRQGDLAAEEIEWPLPTGYRLDRDLYPPHEHHDHRWAMVIDLQACIGCKACETACYAENNIPVVGAARVAEGREMSWLKVVPYRNEQHRLGYLPLPCQHCDAAPCEPVCPVFAAAHTAEGLNAQIYNRCIGTRYCSNNCPYKVRRFNWFNINHPYPESLQLNPEVSVRCRGVMEKCTFCVQRIKQHEHQAMVEHRPLQDGEIVPACAQTCPTGAIVFGDLLDRDSAVTRRMNDPRRYQVLAELNTKPAVIYLRKIDQST